MRDGAAQLFSRDGANHFAAAAGLLAFAGGVSLLLGCLTPLGSLCAGSGSALITFRSAPASLLLDDGPPILFVAGVAAAVVLLGPGAFSLDARLFGRRRVIIPRTPRPPKS